MRPTTILTKHQVKTFGPKQYQGREMIKAEVRYDDECGNGHNSFSITGEIYVPGKNDCEMCGMLHDEIAKSFPELTPYLKWHLVSANEPMHYVANTLYWLGYDTKWCDGKHNAPPNLEYARNTAVWPEMPEDMLETSGKYTRAQITEILNNRLDTLLNDFKQAVESLGFVF